MHIIPFNIGDFSQATERFKPVHLGIFIRLLMEYYKSEKALPAEESELEWIAGVESKSDRDALKLVLRRCFVLDEVRSVWIQKRAERELESYRVQGIQKRYAILCRFWEKVNPGHKEPTLEEFTANVGKYYDEATRRIRVLHGHRSPELQAYSDRDTGLPLLNYDTVTSNQEPVTRNQNTPIVPKGTDTTGLPKAEDVAEAIYAIYPRKVARGAALKAIEKALKKSGLTELEMQARVRAFAGAVARWPKQDQTKFVPNPATWFNQERYMDDPATWERDESAASSQRFGQKKNEGGAPVKPAAPEPEWNWRALHVEVFGREASEEWCHLPKSTRFDLRQMHEKKMKGGAGDE